MRLPLAWLAQYVDVSPDLAEVSATLARLGFPVDANITRPAIFGVVVGTIVRLEKHPNADKLQVCTLDVGAAQSLTIATAATNVAQGQVVPVAVIGAQLPHLRIEPRKMRGIESQGMLCSAEELGLPAEWFEDGIMQLDPGTPNGADVVATFGLAAPVLDIDVGANRPDALCMLGIARELSAATGAALRLPTLAPPAGGDDTQALRVTLESLDVHRYVTQRVSGLDVRPAPAWMRVRLALAGQRPISNLVDISNFVMLECGQPLHFFDYAKIAAKHIIVRDARPGERLRTLDGTERELDATALVIADEDGPTGLAGLMGGSVSEVSPTTREIVIESANFSGPRIRRMSAALGLRTEASTRNEKGLAPALADEAAARAAYLLAELGGTLHPVRAFGRALAAPPVIDLDPAGVERLLGMRLEPQTIRTALESLGFALSATASGFAVTVPAWRSDVAIAADLVEEVARVVGYDRIDSAVPAIAPQALSSATFEREMTLARTLAALGYSECLTLALQPIAVAQRWRNVGLDVPPVVEIQNPLSEDGRWLRFSLLPGLLEHAARERTVRPLWTFEIGHIFADGDPPREQNVVTLLATVKADPQRAAGRDSTFEAVSADLRALVRALTGIDVRLERGLDAGLHPGKTARVIAGDVTLGFAGVVDPRLLRAEHIDDDVVAATLLIDAFPAYHVRRYRTPSKYPAVERDLAFILDIALPAAELSATIRARPLVREAAVFDEYRGPQLVAGKKSLTVRVVLQRDDATLTDVEAEHEVHAIIAAVADAHGATLRE